MEKLLDAVDRDAFKWAQFSVFVTERYHELSTSWWGFPLLTSLSRRACGQVEAS